VDVWGRYNIFRKMLSRKILKRVVKDTLPLPNILAYHLRKGEDLSYLRYFHYGDETERVIGWVKKKMKV